MRKDDYLHRIHVVLIFMMMIGVLSSLVHHCTVKVWIWGRLDWQEVVAAQLPACFWLISYVKTWQENMTHSLSEWGFQVPKRHQAPAHIWGLPRWWKLLLLMYKIFDMRTFGLSHQIKGPTTVKLAIFGYFTIGASFSHFYSCRSFNLMW